MFVTYTVKEVGIHVGISSMIDRFLFEANANLPLIHGVQSITDLLLFMKDQVDFLQHKDITEITNRENSETISRLLESPKDWMSVLHEDTVEYRVRTIFKSNIHRRHTTDVIEHKSFDQSLELGCTFERPENCPKNLRPHKLQYSLNCTQEYLLTMSPNYVL